MADHAALIERLEKLTGPDREVNEAIYKHFNPEYADFVQGRGGLVHPGDGEDVRVLSSVRAPYYTASLDAVIALVERELPGMAWTLGQNVHHRYWVASLNRLNDEGAPESIAWGQSNQPVIALLLALLRAKGGDNG